MTGKPTKRPKRPGVWERVKQAKRQTRPYCHVSSRFRTHDSRIPEALGRRLHIDRDLYTYMTSYLDQA
jgi:hypothetical protein